jgi:lipopolysaccharide export system protein LptA
MRPAVAAAVLLGLLPGLPMLADPATAQNAAIGGGDSPIEVLADDGIEWRRDEQLYIARGNAVATQGDDRVFGDVLVAHYRDTAEGTTEIYRMEARGGARIVSPGRTVTGQTAIYDMDSGILVMRGAPLRMVTDTQTVTARDSLEYWSDDRMAVARGQARAERANGDTVEADVLTAHFGEAGAPAGAGAAADGPSAGPEGVERLEAFDNVVITTAKEVVRGARAVYDVPAGIATVVGDVTISTQTDQLAGERAVVDLNTGVSTLQGGGQDGRARALIAPQRPQTPAPTDTTRDP